jgi:hypothetical protein
MANTTSIIPFIRANEIVFDVQNLKPDKQAHFFFDGVNVDNFVQRASIIQTNSSDVSKKFTRNEGLYCAATRSYAEVISTSSNNIVYINDNYVSINLDFYSTGSSFGANDFKKGDIVFSSPSASSNISANTYSARVQYFHATNKVLIVRTLTGIANTTVPNNSLYNLGSSGSGVRANINSIVLNSRFGAGNTLISTSNSSNTVYVSSYSNYHGSISVKNSNTLNVNLTTYPPANTAGNANIYITSGAGIGTSLRIDSVVNNVAKNNATGFASVTNGTATYSIGTPTVDDYGNLAGIFQLPETDTYKFKTGQRIFTVVDTLNKDDTDNQMKAVSEYVAAGILTNTDQVQVKTTPVVPPIPPSPPIPRFTPAREDVWRNRRDPVAQTFFTPNQENNNSLGIFVSSVDLFFKNKPNASLGDPELPILTRIVTTENGYPTETIVAEVYVDCKDVNTTNGITTFPSTSNSSTATKFKFKDPVYLPPGEQYALIVYSDSPVYEVWITELGQAIIGDTNNRRVSEQPYAGSFFRSQNASTWTSFQNEDLMFVINKAVFDTSAGATLTLNVLPPTVNVGMHNLLLHSSDIAFKNTELGYRFKSTLASTGAADSGYTNIEKDKIFNFSSDLKTSSLNANRKRVVLAGNADSMLVQVTMNTTQNNISPIVNSERLALIAEEYVINNGELSVDNITITNGGGVHASAANITVTISAPQLYSDDPLSTATANVITSGIVSGNVVSINLINVGKGYIESPTITISEPGKSANATAVIVSEDGKSGGNSLARYLTKKIALADGFDAGDMRVFVEAIRPQGTNIIAYYKVLSDSDSEQFNDKKWKRMYLINDTISLDTTTPVELVFRPAEIEGSLSYVENNVTYPLGGTFKYFAIKLVMLAADPSVPPIIRNLRAIALPAG